MEYHLERLRPRQLRELGERHRVSLLGLKRKSDLVAAIAAAPGSPEIFMELEAQDTAERDSGLVLGRDADVDYERVEELLEQARKRFQERQFEAALTAAQEASRIADRTTEQLRRASWSYAVLAAQGLLEPCNAEDPETATARALLDRARDVFFQGQLLDDAFLQGLVRAAAVADMREAEDLHQAAQTAIAAGEHGHAGDLLKRAERLAMKGQQRQIERAMQLRQAQVEKAQAIIGACEPVLKEAESYDLSATEVRVLLRQARDVLTKGDYVAGLTFARNAEEAAQRLEAEVARLVEAVGRGGGFTAKKLAVGVEFLRRMSRRPECPPFLSFPPALMAPGVRGALRALVEEKPVAVVVTTGGTADHDLARVWQ